MVADNIKALQTEWIKLKRSGTFWICLGATIFIPLLLTVGYMVAGKQAAGEDPWNSLLRQNLQAFTGFFYPVFLVIIVARMVYLEHRSDTWKLLETQPISKAALYLAKWQIMLIISLLCLLGLVLFSLGGGLIIQAFEDKESLAKSSIDWGVLAKIVFRFWIASFGLITIQYVIGLWNKSFVLPLAIGLVGTIAGGILSGFGKWVWWPYSAPANTSSTYAGSLTGDILLHHEIMSLLWAALFLWIGYRLYIKKGFVRGFLKPAPVVGVFVAVLGAFGILAWLVNKPVTIPSYGKTIMAGNITAEKPVEQVVIMSALTFDTVAVIPVTNGKYHYEETKKLEAGIYLARAAKANREVYFGTGDSIHIDWDFGKQGADIKITGTTVAENKYLEGQTNNDFYLLTNFAYQYKPDEYADEIVSEWESGLNKIRKFKTPDNIKPSAEFVKVQEKLLAIQLLRLAEIEYPKVYALYYPNEEFTFPPKLASLKQAASLDDERLAGYREVSDYFTQLYRNKSGINDSAYVHLVNKEVKQQKLRDVLIYQAIQNALPRIKDSSVRSAYMHNSMGYISNQRLKADLVQTNDRLKGLQRGKPAFAFTGEAINGREISLAQLAKRYVVIDVWATWCGPCKKESPYFEELAENYTSNQVAFVAVSIDEDKMPWRMEAPSKSNRVLQLWVKNDNKDFTTQFAINSIPRFMLIGPDGRIINANMPSPSDPAFEEILIKEIPELRSGML